MASTAVARTGTNSTDSDSDSDNDMMIFDLVDLSDIQPAAPVPAPAPVQMDISSGSDGEQKDSSADDEGEDNDDLKPLMTLRQRRQKRLYGNRGMSVLGDGSATLMSAKTLKLASNRSAPNLNLLIQEDESDDEDTLTQRKQQRRRKSAHTKTETRLNSLNDKLKSSPNLQDMDDVPPAAAGSCKPFVPRLASYIQKSRKNWTKAIMLIGEMEDPWKHLNFTECEKETVIRHRYNALREKWVEDTITVRMQKQSFNRGAMRACFRLKKDAKIKKKKRNHSLVGATNYVAKRYMEDVNRQVYFDDVKLQMDAKLWAEEFNRHNPPKKIDIFQMSVIEFVGRPDKPLYHLEHFIEGQYIKYNSNSGFVDDNLRNTPHAFSHFTFERSGHKLIVVDIQGVGDLWTDPQIHTSVGTDYGDGNLGTRGMALFFHSHYCNSICKSLRLSSFDLASTELSKNESFTAKKQLTRRGTVASGMVHSVISASPTERSDLNAFLARSRSRTISSNSSNMFSIGEELDIIEDEELDDDDSGLGFSHQQLMRMSSHLSSDVADSEVSESDTLPESPLVGGGGPFSPGMMIPVRRQRFISSESDDSCASSLTQEEDTRRFHEALNMVHRPSCINLDASLGISICGESVLGQIHHDLAKYHELGRFLENDDDNRDWGACLYHEKHAADLGVMEAITTLAKMYVGLQRDVLQELTVHEDRDNINQGLEYMEMAADAGDRSSMLFLAQAFESGLNLGEYKSQDYDEACKWYKKAVDKMQECGSGEEFDATMDWPVYQLKAKMAELYMHGGPQLNADPNYSGELYQEAADAAMEAMKGRMANKYYALAEEAWALVEEPE